MIKVFSSILICSMILLAGEKGYSEGSFEFKNDLFFKEDKDYTGAFEITYSPAHCSITYSFGQDIYTPDNEDINTPIAGEHPYAGWLYFGISKEYMYDNIRAILGVEVGTVGEDSGAEQTSKMVHNINDSHNGNGWDTQMHKSFAYIATAKINYESEFLETDLIKVTPYIIGQAGNIIQNYGAGIDFRIDANKYFDVYANIESKHISKNYFLEGEAKNKALTYRVEKKDTVNHIELGIETKYINDIKYQIGVESFSKTYTTQKDNSKLGIIKITMRF